MAALVVGRQYRIVNAAWPAVGRAVSASADGAVGRVLLEAWYRGRDVLVSVLAEHVEPADLSCLPKRRRATLSPRKFASGVDGATFAPVVGIGAGISFGVPCPACGQVAPKRPGGGVAPHLDLRDDPGRICTGEPAKK